MFYVDAHPSLVSDFHASQAVRAQVHERAIVKMAEQQPAQLALLLRANPAMLNNMGDPEVVAKAMTEAGYVQLCDDIAHSLDVNRDVRCAFKARGQIDWY
jgi:hypothetical protein